MHIVGKDGPPVTGLSPAHHPLVRANYSSKRINPAFRQLRMAQACPWFDRKGAHGSVGFGPTHQHGVILIGIRGQKLHHLWGQGLFHHSQHPLIILCGSQILKHGNAHHQTIFGTPRLGAMAKDEELRRQ